jgi:hypothetical protein
MISSHPAQVVFASRGRRFLICLGTVLLSVGLTVLFILPIAVSSAPPPEARWARSG